MIAARRREPILRAVAIAAGLLAATAPARGQTMLDFVTFDEIDYVRWADELGRPLTSGDLGVEFGVVGCSFSEDRRGCPYGTDAAAAFMPAGTRMFAIKGHSTDFRLAAVWKGAIFLYQAWRNPRARTGGQLYEIAGKVDAIEAQHGEPAAGTEARVRITSPQDTRALVDMIVRGAVRAPQAHAFGEPRYWLTFWLSDGTTLGRPYFVDTRELMGGVALPEAFTEILEHYLKE